MDEPKEPTDLPEEAPEPDSSALPADPVPPPEDDEVTEESGSAASVDGVESGETSSVDAPVEADAEEPPPQETVIDSSQSAPFPDAVPATVVLVAELPQYQTRAEQDPEHVPALLGRMQQIVGEAVFLYDGRVMEDPFSPLLIAQMPDAASGMDALRKIEQDLREANERPGASPIDARVVLHAGDVREKDGSLVGHGVESALAIVDSLAPLQIAVSGRVLTAAGLSPDSDAVTRLGDDSFFDLTSVPAPVDDEATVLERSADVRPPGRGFPRWALGALVGLAAIAVIAAVLMTRGGSTPSVTRAAATVPLAAASPTAPESAAESYRVALERFDAQLPDPRVAADATLMRAVAARLLSAYPQVTLVDAAGPAEVRIGVRTDLADGETRATPFLLRGANAEEGEAIPVSDPGVAGAAVSRWAAAMLELKRPGVISEDPEALQHFAQAIRIAGVDRFRPEQKALDELEAATEKDPRFLGAWIFDAELEKAAGNDEEALAAIRKAVALSPDDLTLARRVGRWELEGGNPADALDSFAAILKLQPGDIESMRAIGFHAVSVADEPKFNAALQSLSVVPDDQRELHDGDLLAANGRINQAVDRYYEIEKQTPNDPALAFKIGRIAVLRRSMEIANLEMEKLSRLRAPFHAPMLRAYIAAEKGDREEAEAALLEAERNATWSSAYNTYAAEVYTVLDQTGKVLPALRRAVGRGEPTLQMIETNPLFRFLQGDAGYQSLTREVDEKKAAIVGKLSSIQF